MSDTFNHSLDALDSADGDNRYELDEDDLKRKEYSYHDDAWIQKNQYYRINHEIFMVTEYPKSCLFEIDGVDKWIPRSLMVYDDEDRLFLPLWFIKKNNFEIID